MGFRVSGCVASMSFLTIRVCCFHELLGIGASSYGLLAFTIRTEEELLSALEAGRNQPLPVLYDIKVLPGSMTPGFDSWWRVGVAEVSEMERVQQAYQEQQNHIQSVREF